ncbi:hypothetical protein M514_24526 [Trichuris suis]|uniref:Uncharacterized protein n=1 Tax=Trichuris suis TaxID=68888 RepID=A0A085N1K0_9BILA|nr:hypothetical protein M514_24526 [Trichuris suis]
MKQPNISHCPFARTMATSLRALCTRFKDEGSPCEADQRGERPSAQVEMPEGAVQDRGTYTAKMDFRTSIMPICSWSNDYCSTRFCSKELGNTVVMSADANNSIADLIEPSMKCAVSWKKRLRDVSAESLLSNPLLIGCPNRTVEVDETLFSKWKTHKAMGLQGRMPNTGKSCAHCEPYQRDVVTADKATHQTRHYRRD